MENSHLIGLAVTILLAACGIVWRVTRVEVALRAEFNSALLAAHEKVHAANEKIYQVEIWARDEFVRKGSFEAVVARLEKGMEGLGNTVEKAVDKMTDKIDNIIAGRP